MVEVIDYTKNICCIINILKIKRPNIKLGMRLAHIQEQISEKFVFYYKCSYETFEKCKFLFELKEDDPPPNSGGLTTPIKFFIGTGIHHRGLIGDILY